MKSTESRSAHGRRMGRRLPVDLLVMVAFVLVADAVVSASGTLPILRVVVGFPILFFVPGYVVLAALFPGESTAGATSEPRLLAAEAGLALSTRLALSFAISVALVPVSAVALAFTPVGFGAASLLGLLTVVVVVGAAVGALRRLRLPPEARFSVPARQRIFDLAGFVTGAGSALGVAVNLLLVLSVVVAATGFAYAVFVPPANQQYEDFMLLTEGPAGEYVSSGYPTDVTQGEPQQLVVGIANHREVETRYSIVVELQRTRGVGSDFQVVERSELGRLGATVGPGETVYRPHQVTPDMAGDNLRLIYYLYRGDAPQDPSVETANEHVHLWINSSVGGSS